GLVAFSGMSVNGIGGDPRLTKIGFEFMHACEDPAFIRDAEQELLKDRVVAHMKARSSRTVDAVAGRISRRRGRRCMTTGGAFTASTGNSCCGIGESFWNEASPTPMKREACGVCTCADKRMFKRELIHLGGFNLSLI